MKCQNLFSEKNKKNIINLLSAEIAQGVVKLSSFAASGDFCPLLITFAYSLDPDQARQDIGPDLEPNCLTLLWYSWKIVLKKVNLKKKNPQMTKSMQNYPACKELKAPITTAADDNFDIFF